jgi:hypothetical protein
MSAAIAVGMAFPGAGCGERGKFLGQFFGTAVWARGAFPIAGADENLAVALALLAMKFVNRHGMKIADRPEILKPWPMGCF